MRRIELSEAGMLFVSAMCAKEKAAGESEDGLGCEISNSVCGRMVSVGRTELRRPRAPNCARIPNTSMTGMTLRERYERYELSPVRPPLTLVASLIKPHIGTPENVGRLPVSLAGCSPHFSPIESPDVYSLTPLPLRFR